MRRSYCYTEDRSSAGVRQLLIYHLTFSPTSGVACPGCAGLADHFDGALPQVNNRDVTSMVISRAPIEKLAANKRRFLLAPLLPTARQVPDGRDGDFPLRRHDEY
jgi:hypothetical protein